MWSENAIKLAGSNLQQARDTPHVKVLNHAGLQVDRKGKSSYQQQGKAKFHSGYNLKTLKQRGYQHIPGTSDRKGAGPHSTKRSQNFDHNQSNKRFAPGNHNFLKPAGKDSQVSQQSRNQKFRRSLSGRSFKTKSSQQ